MISVYLCVLAVIYNVELCGVCLFVLKCEFLLCLMRLCVLVFDVLCDVVWCVLCVACVCVCVWFKCVRVF